MEKINVMIVEDEALVSADLKATLEELGNHVCSVVRYGEKVREEVEKHHPDLIMMDIRLKGEMDGIQAAALVRKQYDIPILFLTAYADEVTLKRALQADPFAYLKKPIRLDELRTNLELTLYKSNMERKLKESELRYRTVADYNYDWETWLDPEGHFVYMSPSCERISGHAPEEFLENRNLFLDIVHPENRHEFQEHLHECHHAEAGVCSWEFRILDKDGREKWLEHWCQPVFSPKGRYLGRRASNRDITERKRLEQERENLIKELEKALADVKQLSRLLPMCAKCKKIRDDEGYWLQVEEYFRQHSNTEFSHGICPECAKELYPEIVRAREKRKTKPAG